MDELTNAHSDSTNGVTLKGKLVVGDGLADGKLSLNDSNGVQAEMAAVITGSGILHGWRPGYRRREPVAAPGHRRCVLQ